MHNTTFAAICAKYFIAPSVALENDNVVNALRNDDIQELERVLREEF
jgi:hypothetical protein